MTKRDGVTRGTGSHLYTRGQGLYFRSEHSVRFSTTYHPLLRRSRCAHGAAQGAAEGVNGVLHRVPRVRMVCVGCLAPVLVTCAVSVEAVEIRLTLQTFH